MTMPVSGPATTSMPDRRTWDALVAVNPATNRIRVVMPVDTPDAKLGCLRHMVQHGINVEHDIVEVTMMERMRLLTSQIPGATLKAMTPPEASNPDAAPDVFDVGGP